MYVCMYVCYLRERDRERQRETERQRDRERQRETERERESESLCSSRIGAERENSELSVQNLMLILVL